MFFNKLSRTLAWRQQEQVYRLSFAAGGARDLPSIVNAERIQQGPPRPLSQSPIKVDHSATPPQKSMAFAPRDIGSSHHLPTVVDSGRLTRIVAQRTQIAHRAPGIEKGMNAVGAVAESNNLPAIVDRPRAASTSMGECPQIDDLAIHP